MKKKIVTALMIVLVLVVAMASFTGCFFKNLSIIGGENAGGGKGSMATEDEKALAAFDQEPVTETSEGEYVITLSNFTQINKASMSMGANSAMMVTEFKFTETGFYYHVYQEDTAGQTYTTAASEVYFEKDGDYWFEYKQNPNNANEWKVAAVNLGNIAGYLTAKNGSFSEDTRANLFKASNYKKKSSDKYEYVGPTVSLKYGNEMSLVMNVEGLFKSDKGIEIKGQAEMDVTEEQKAAAAQAGYALPTIPFSYSIVNVGKTKITYPNVLNSEYKANYKAQQDALKGIDNDDDDADDEDEEKK